MEGDEEIVSGEAAAHVLGVSLATLSRMVKRGDLRPNGYNPVLKRQKLDFDRAYLEEYKRRAAGEPPTD